MDAHRFPACGCWLFLYNPLIAEMAGQAGYDYVVVDMEHAPGTLDNVLPMIQAAQLGGARALVRVPETDPRWIGRVMDLGADGAVVPMVNDAGEAGRMAAGACYPPGGNRGMAAPFVRASRYGAGLDDYLANARERFLLTVQIESAQAVGNAAAIAQVEGVDAILVGPFDLSASLGYTGQPDHPRVRESIALIAQAVHAAGKRLVSLPTPAVGIEQLYGEGCDLVLGGTDLPHMRRALYADAAAHRAAAPREGR